MVQSWWKVAITSDLADGGRLHTCVNGRYITLFRQRNVLSAIDAGELLLLEIFADIE